MADFGEFKIESGVPAPRAGVVKTTTRHQMLRALAAAKIGDSLLIPEAEFAGTHAQRCVLVKSMARTVGGCTSWVTSRVEEGGVRVWKVAEPKVVA